MKIKTHLNFLTKEQIKVQNSTIHQCLKSVAASLSLTTRKQCVSTTILYHNVHDYTLIYRQSNNKINKQILKLNKINSKAFFLVTAWKVGTLSLSKYCKVCEYWLKFWFSNGDRTVAAKYSHINGSERVFIWVKSSVCVCVFGSSRPMHQSGTNTRTNEI